MFKIILNNECCPHGMHPSAKHGHFRCRYNGANEMCSKNICPLDTDLKAKHDELVKINEKLKQNLLAEEEEHNETMKKHDELAELMACFFAIQDAMIWGRPIYGNASIRLMERNRLSKALRKALRKAVEEG
jgi:hypothetical protein